MAYDNLVKALRDKNATLKTQNRELREALERFLGSSVWKCNCDENDMTCDTMFARYVLKKLGGELDD